MTGLIDPIPVGTARTRRLMWLFAFLGFFLVIGAWSVAAPYSGTPDEQDHILRAYGVATGQIVLDPAPAQRGAGAFVEAPQSLVIKQCWQFESDKSAACAVEPGGDTTTVTAPTGAGRYFPFYYALVGGPLALWPSWLGVLLARLISAGLCAALLANALTDAMRWSRHRLMSVGVLIATTPMVAHMGGAINPSGVELAAGIAFFAAAIPLLYAPAAARNTTLLWHAGIAALGLATLRMAGPLFLLLAVVGLLILVGRAQLRQLWKWRALRWWAVGVGGAALAAIGYTIVFKSADLGSHFVSNRWATTQLLWIETQRWHQYFDEMIGVTSWLDTRMPEIVYVLWQAAAATAIVVGFLVARRDGRWRMALLFLAGTLVPLVMAVRYANEVGFITQGRYLLPLLVGLPLLGVFLIQEHGVSERDQQVRDPGCCRVAATAAPGRARLHHGPLAERARFSARGAGAQSLRRLVAPSTRDSYAYCRFGRRPVRTRLAGLDRRTVALVHRPRRWWRGTGRRDTEPEAAGASDRRVRGERSATCLGR